nr:hypothetical protein [uncultured Tolumonas sp.]
MDNPVGLAWTATELRQPYAALGADFLAQSITGLSPSNTFNIAGLQIANIVDRRSSFMQSYR